MRKHRAFAGLATGLSAIVLTSFLTAPRAQADHHEGSNDYSMKLNLNSDSFFGFNPFFIGTYKLDDSMDFTFYGIQWSAGTGGDSGDAAGAGWGNWTEFGAGVAFKVGDFVINPQLGILNGALTSNNTHARAFEGLVPNLTVNYDHGALMAELYAGYYYGFEGNQKNSNNYLHYWLNGGYRISDFFSAGAHYESLVFMGGVNRPTDAGYEYYMAVGPFVQFSDPKGRSFVRFNVGRDLRSAGQRDKSGTKLEDFYKLTIGMTL